MIQLSEWSCGTIHADAYRAPETRGIRLSGRVTGHPKRRDGSRVITSPVRTVMGRVVKTASGSVYELVGEPEPDYLEYLREIGREYDPEKPISVRIWGGGDG